MSSSKRSKQGQVVSVNCRTLLLHCKP